MREVCEVLLAQQTPAPTLQPSAALQPLQRDRFARRRAAATSRRDGARRWTRRRPAEFRLLPRARSALTNARHEKSPACKLSHTALQRSPFLPPPPEYLRLWVLGRAHQEGCAAPASQAGSAMAWNFISPRARLNEDRRKEQIYFLQCKYLNLMPGSGERCMQKKKALLSYIVPR